MKIIIIAKTSMNENVIGRAAQESIYTESQGSSARRPNKPINIGKLYIHINTWI